MLRNLIILFFTFLVFGRTGGVAVAHTEVYKADTSLSSIDWHTMNGGEMIKGNVRLSKGELRDNHGNISGDFEADMNTLSMSHENSANGKNWLAQIKSPEFFDVTQFPRSSFVLTGLTQFGNPSDSITHKVTGIVTIRGKSKNVEFGTMLSPAENGFSFSGTVNLSWKDFEKNPEENKPGNSGNKSLNEFTLRFRIHLSR